MTTAAIATYQCPACRRSYAADRPLWRCDCGSHLNLAPGRGLARSEIAASEASLWRYTAALAVCVSQSTGTVAVFKAGRLVTDIPRATGVGRLAF